MAEYITELEVSINKDDEKRLRDEFFNKLDVDVAQGNGPNKIFIWYKKNPEKEGITRIQLTYMSEMETGLKSAGYSKIEKNLTPGSRDKSIYLWHYSGNLESDVPIVDLAVTADSYDEGQKFRAGWERMACDLTRVSSGNRVYLWMKRANKTYICEVDATDGFGRDKDFIEKGFIRMDENTNRGADGALVYLWYRLTKNHTKAITDLDVSLNAEEYEALQKKGYKRVTADLNIGCGAASEAYLWFKERKENYSSIQTFSMITDPSAVSVYERANVQVIKKNIAKTFEYLCYYR